MMHLSVARSFAYTFDNVPSAMTDRDARELAGILSRAGFEELGREIERAAGQRSEAQTFAFEHEDLDIVRGVLRGRKLRPGSGLSALRELLDQPAFAQPRHEHEEGGEG
jgi:hypothetical protein